MNAPLVVKIGGSLYPHARMIIPVLLNSGRDALIIPGGGLFADNVRKTGISGTEAHWMAIAAMDQYGWYLSSLGIPVTTKPEFCGRPTIFLPYTYLREKNPLSHSWDITSDTISAWIASHLSAPLLILKSIDKIRADGREIDEIREEIKTTDLDPAFIPFVHTRRISCQIINGTNEQRLFAALNNELVPGTRLSNTI